VWALRRRTDPLRVAKAETWSRASASSIAARVRAIVDIDARESLQRCRQPVLCVHFHDDQIVTRRSADEIQRHGAAIKVVTLPGVPRGLFPGPAALAAEVVRFIQDLEF